MTAFSEADLIGQEMHKSLSTVLLSFFKVTLQIMLPADIFFRAQVLCEDIAEVNGQSFRLDDLMDLLWTDLMDHVREHQDIQETYKLLLEYDQGTPNVRIVTPKKAEDVPLYPIRKRRDDVQTYYCSMIRKKALRGEVMLQDIASLYPNHPFTLERVLEILLIDFIIKYRKGKAAKLVMAKLQQEE